MSQRRAQGFLTALNPSYPVLKWQNLAFFGKYFFHLFIKYLKKMLWSRGFNCLTVNCSIIKNTVVTFYRMSTGIFFLTILTLTFPKIFLNEFHIQITFVLYKLPVSVKSQVTVFLSIIYTYPSPHLNLDCIITTCSFCRLYLLIS